MWIYELKMPTQTPRGPSWLPAAALPVSPAGTGHGRDHNLPLETLPKLQSCPVKVWDGLENPISWAMRQQEPGGAALGAVPAVIPWLQQLSWPPATVPTAP